MPFSPPFPRFSSSKNSRASISFKFLSKLFCLCILQMICELFVLDANSCKVISRRVRPVSGHSLRRSATFGVSDAQRPRYCADKGTSHPQRSLITRRCTRSSGVFSKWSCRIKIVIRQRSVRLGNKAQPFDPDAYQVPSRNLGSLPSVV